SKTKAAKAAKTAKTAKTAKVFRRQASRRQKKVAGRGGGKARRRARRHVRRRLHRPRRKPKRCRYRGKDRFPPMALFHANHRERLSLRLFDKCGRRLSNVARRVRHFLRYTQTRRSHAIHPRLIRNLYRVSRAFKGREIIVYSGFRDRRVARHKVSYHNEGRAIDFRVAGIGNRRLRDYLLRHFKKVGIGYYPNVPFVHLDVRPKRSAFWIDFSGSGEVSRYAHNPRALLRRERRGIPIREKRRVLVIIDENPSRKIVLGRGCGAHDEMPPSLSRQRQVSREISPRALAAVREALRPLVSSPQSRGRQAPLKAGKRARVKRERAPKSPQLAPIPPLPTLPPASSRISARPLTS
ncbi:MAG: DUF882 domain-containing protein, partial [Deltaproteobacteria bacterium]|nr:DUF882 domain-containing protein [Deltaproteobacteria bacterium]